MQPYQYQPTFNVQAPPPPPIIHQGNTPFQMILAVLLSASIAFLAGFGVGSALTEERHRQQALDVAPAGPPPGPVTAP